MNAFGLGLSLNDSLAPGYWKGDGADGEPCEAETQTRERTGLFGWSQVRATSVTIYIHIYIYIYNRSLPTMSTKLLMSGKYLVTK